MPQYSANNIIQKGTRFQSDLGAIGAVKESILQQMCGAVRDDGIPLHLTETYSSAFLPAMHRLLRDLVVGTGGSYLLATTTVTFQ